MEPKKLNAHVYTVTYSRPKGERGYRPHGSIRVLASSLQDAVYMIERTMPDAHIWTCAHQGTISLCSDASLLTLCMAASGDTLAVIGECLTAQLKQEREGAHDNEP